VLDLADSQLPTRRFKGLGFEQFIADQEFVVDEIAAAAAKDACRGFATENKSSPPIQIAFTNLLRRLPDPLI
jgi:hypothetical protein